LVDGGPLLIDPFAVSPGEICPGCTPTWSAPEQILGEPVSAAADFYPIGKMIADVLGGELVGEVRKFKARLIDQEAREFDIFYNPTVHVRRGAPAASGQALAAWQSLAWHCLRFVPTDRPQSARELEERIREVANTHPLSGEARISIPSELRVRP
jgi:serine/threonine protein kinase